MRLKLYQVGEPVLGQPARELTSDEIRSPSIQQLIEFMRETMRDARGVGLAASQVGESLQLAVIEDREEAIAAVPAEMLVERQRAPTPFHVIINPRLTITNSTVVAFFEGCLSLPSFHAIVPRALEVRINCLNEKAESVVINASGWYARILQHEIDHLNGRLYVERMEPRSFTTADNYARYWKDLSTNDVLEKIGGVDKRRYSVR